MTMTCKRFVAVVTAIMLVICMMPGLTAKAAETKTISSISFEAKGLKAPAAGVTLDDFFPSSFESYTEGCLTPAQYEETLTGQGIGDGSGSLWVIYDGERYRFMDETFYAGEVYEYRLTMYAAEGYSFTQDMTAVMKYDGGNKEISSDRVSVSANGTEVTMYFVFKAGDKAPEENITAPKKATIKSLTSGTSKLTVKMSGKPSAIGGATYKIGYKMKGTSTWKYTTTTSASKTISKLKKGKRYYVKVRAYKKVGTEKIYGAWSASKLSGTIK